MATNNFNKTELKKRGWTDTLIAKLLGKPDAKRNRGRAMGAVLFFDRDRVEAAEKDASFIAGQKRFNAVIAARRLFEILRREFDSWPQDCRRQFIATAKLHVESLECELDVD